MDGFPLKNTMNLYVNDLLRTVCNLKKKESINKVRIIQNIQRKLKKHIRLITYNLSRIFMNTWPFFKSYMPHISGGLRVFT